LPATDGGTLTSTSCVPTESLLDFEIKNTQSRVKIRASARDRRRTNLVYLGFSGNLWSSINFTSTDFMIRDLEKNITIRSLSVYAHKHDGYDPLSTEPYFAPPNSPISQAANLPRFSVDIKFAEPMPRYFELIGPSILINDEEIEFPSIRFEKKLWIGVSPLNC
jgi:hypothetical protein